MSVLLGDNDTLSAGSKGYIEASYDNYIDDADIMLYALNGQAQSASITFTGINTPLTAPISGTRQFSFTVLPGHKAVAYGIQSAVEAALASIPNISNIDVQNVYSGTIGTSISSIVNSLAGQPPGSGGTPSNTDYTMYAILIVIILGMIIVVEHHL